MPTEQNGYGKQPEVRWVRAESGATYLCPAAILEFIDELSEEDLKAICVQKSKHQHLN